MSSPITLFPNPAKDILHIRMDKVQSRDRPFSITNHKGEYVMSGTLPAGDNEYIIEVACLKAGTYILAVGTNGSKKFKEFIIVR